MPLSKVNMNVEMNVYEAILSRRSVRSYTLKEVGFSTLRTLLEAAIWAPTAMHEEPWAFAIIQDRKQLKNLSDAAKPLFIEQAKRDGGKLYFANSEEFNIFYDAGTLIIICTNLKETFVNADCWMAAENLMLAACAMQLGTCVIGAALPALAVAENKAKLGIPDGYAAVVPIIVGYASGDFAHNTRKPPVIFTKY